MLSLYSCAIKYYRERNKGCPDHVVLLSVFVEKLPSRCDLYEQVSAYRRVVRAGGHVAHSRSLCEQFLGTRDDVGKTDVTLLEKFAVDVYLVVVARLYIFALTVNCAKIHVQQVCRAVDVERSCGDAVFLIVHRLVVCVTGAGEHEEHFVASDGILYFPYKCRDYLVQLEIKNLHLCLPVGFVLAFGGQYY